MQRSFKDITQKRVDFCNLFLIMVNILSHYILGLFRNVGKDVLKKGGAVNKSGLGNRVMTIVESSFSSFSAFHENQL